MIARDGVIHGANCRGMGVMKIRTQKSRRQSRLPKPSEPSPRLSLQVALCAGGGAEPFTGTGKLQRIGPRQPRLTRRRFTVAHVAVTGNRDLKPVCRLIRTSGPARTGSDVSSYGDSVIASDRASLAG